MKKLYKQNQMKKFLTTAFAALAIISCEKPGSDVYDLTVHSFTAKGNSPSLTAKSGNNIDFTLNGDAFTATDGNILKLTQSQAIVNYVIPSAYGEYLEMIIDVQDGGPVGIAFKFWHGPESFYSFYFDQIETDESKTAWIARASAGIVDEVTNDLGYTGMNVGDNLEGQVEISISKESAAAGGTSKTFNPSKAWRSASVSGDTEGAYYSLSGEDIPETAYDGYPQDITYSDSYGNLHVTFLSAGSPAQDAKIEIVFNGMEPNENEIQNVLLQFESGGVWGKKYKMSTYYINILPATNCGDCVMEINLHGDLVSTSGYTFLADFDIIIHN